MLLIPDIELGCDEESEGCLFVVAGLTDGGIKNIFLTCEKHHRSYEVLYINNEFVLAERTLVGLEDESATENTEG